MKHLPIILLIFFGITTKVFSTAQIPDILIIGKDTLPIFSLPLEKIIRPQFIDEFGEVNFPEFAGCGSTACWRGYVAYWKIEKSKLYLIKITSCHRRDCEGHTDANLSKMFGADYIDGKVFAKWYSDTLIAPKGKRLAYIHMGFASIYEKEINIAIENGVVKSKKTVSSTSNLHKLNYLLNRSSSYVLDTIQKLINKSIKKEDFLESQFVITFYTFKINHLGKITNIDITAKYNDAKNYKKQSWECRRLTQKLRKILLSKKVRKQKIPQKTYYSYMIFNMEMDKNFNFNTYEVSALPPKKT